MLVKATRAISALTLRALFYGALFVVVVIVHMGITGSLREQGLGGAFSLVVSGAVVLGVVLLSFSAADWLREWREASLEAARVRLRLPGPCCVYWPDDKAAEAAMQWELAGPLRARYPWLLERLGIEGVAVVDFEVSAEGRAKNIRCIHSWPTDAFYESTRDALARAKFEPKPDLHVHHGVSYQLPFVFRLDGARRARARGSKAGPDAAAGGVAGKFTPSRITIR